MPTKKTEFGGPCIICGDSISAGITGPFKSLEVHFIDKHGDGVVSKHKKRSRKTYPPEMFDRSEYVREPQPYRKRL